MIMNSSIYGCSADSTEIQRIIQHGIYPSKDTGIATRGERRGFLVVPAIFYPSRFFLLDTGKRYLGFLHSSGINGDFTRPSSQPNTMS